MSNMSSFKSAKGAQTFLDVLDSHKEHIKITKAEGQEIAWKRKASQENSFNKLATLIEASLHGVATGINLME